jgi:signal transduction histidine kinase
MFKTMSQFFSRSTIHGFRDRTVITLIILLAVTLALVMWQLNRLSERIINVAAVEGTGLYIRALEEFRNLYTHEVVERLSPLGIEAVHDYVDHPRAIPLPATLTIMFGQQLSDKDNKLLVRLYSDYPFSSRHGGGPHDAFEQEALARLTAQPDQPVIRFEPLDGIPVIRYAMADQMRSSCVSCHNNHPFSQKKDWKVGDVRGVLEVTRPLTKAVSESRSGLHEMFFIFCALAASGTLAVGLVIGKLRGTTLELEQTVQNRTAELAEAKQTLERQVEQLQDARQRVHAQAKELERSNAELEQFAFVASHDLREPLRMIRSFSQLLAKRYKGELDTDADEFLGYVISGGQRMEEFIEGLLQYARVGGSGEMPEPVDCDLALKQALKNLASAIMESHAEITYDPLPTVLGRDLQLTQLFQNLIQNALKFRGDAPPRVHVSVQREPGMWQIGIADNGIGISPQAADRIFELFRRESEEHAGTGIGLAVCKKIVESHGGQIWAESEPGHGTTVRFTLPISI